MSIWDPLQGVTEPKFSISSHGLGHVTPKVLDKPHESAVLVHSLYRCSLIDTKV